MIDFSIYPDADNTILPEESTVLSVRFNTSMDKLNTQKVLSVQVSGSSVRGDIFWNGNELRFIPLEYWLPGVRYTLNLEGMIYALDGREERIKRHVSFYALHREAAPYVAVYTPADGSSVGVRSEEGAFVNIVFSRPMDRQSTIDAFYIDGASEWDFIWSSDDTVLEIHPKNNLNPWVVYRWGLSNKAKGKNGVPLGREINCRFVTDADRILPAVKDVFPLIRGSISSGLWWIKTGSSITDGFGPDQAIGIEFNKPMDESALRTIRFEPSLAGHSEMWKPDTIVFIPDRDPDPEKTYTLIVSADARDSGGLRMEKDFSLSFIADIPFLSIISLDAGFGGVVPVHNGIYYSGAVLPEGICTVTVRFSHAISPLSQSAIVLALRLETFFPGTLKPVSLRSARWWSADTVVLQWEGIERSTAGEKHYYRLVLPGGRSGISDGKGSYLKEDMFIFLEIEGGGS
ncbi:MAG: Ig-like domain-containing protein [Treponema sp.]|nr:Ig-like domain-containing protein [Treponema sp.]